MTLARKQTIAATALLVLFLWPFCHRALVYQYDISPWRFCGFAMYCVPKPELHITPYRGDGSKIAVDPKSPKQDALNEYGFAWVSWGPHGPPVAFGRAMADDETNPGRISVVIRERRLDRASARIVEKRYAYRCPVD